MWGSRKRINLDISTCIVFLFMAAKGKLSLCNGGIDTLSRGQRLSGSQTLISKQRNFELGFFTPGGSSSQSSYLGIWHTYFPDGTIVWVANREAPLQNSISTRLEIAANGNLGLFHDSDIIWSTNLTVTSPDAVEIVLLDTGNLILRDSLIPETVYWQSFDHPTNTWLPGATLGFNKITSRRRRLVSWKTSSDPSPGMFSLEMSHDQPNELFLHWNRSTTYWRSGSWNGVTFNSVPEISYLANFTVVSNENETYCSYTSLNDKVALMFVINAFGNLEQRASMLDDQNKEPIHVRPANQSEIFALCGAFGMFIEGSPSNPCTCLPGFAPLLASPKDYSGGCYRKSLLQCENSSLSQGQKDGFLEIPVSNLSANPKTDPAQNAKRCELTCLQHCSCSAYAYNGGKCSIWNGDLLNLQNVSEKNGGGKLQYFYLKVSKSELQNAKGRKKIREVIVAVVVPVVILVAGGFLSFFYTRKTKYKENRESGEDLLSFDFDLSAAPSNNGTVLRKRSSTEFDLPIFTYTSVSASTNNFSPENKLGEGGFGPVYKGKLLNGQEIALKRLSKKSGQGLEEFRNEILLIARLQHRNLVQILGCCIDPSESILIYEYMPNKSLDYFLYGSNKHELLNWATRIRIIEGIAQGLLYLHEYSRLNVIHRDLKASNILLDSEMNPKISDFGMARIFVGNASESHTNRIVGTYGYMAPEYVLRGLYSIKSDVFSFGVLILEIVSGKKNTGFYQSDSVNLLGHAWELWCSNRGDELIDPAMGCPQVSMALRYIHIGLLCVQENPDDRPNMPKLVSMLSSEIGLLSAPKQPAFCIGKGTTKFTPSTNDGGSTNRGEDCTVNGLTVSMIEPR